MVKGLDLFRDHFREHSDCYVLIGGTASHLALREEGLDFRATKDLDIILCVEARDERFQEPSDPAYPYMLKLFSRQPDGINVPPGVHLTPIPTDSDLSSLSAILLDDTYYRWVMAGRRDTGGITTVGPEHLIPLKAHAHLDLRARRERGERVKASDIKKHRNDVVRLAQLLAPTPIADVPAVARVDLRAFLAVLDLDAERLRNLKVAFPTPEAVTRLLETAYSL